MLILRVLTSLGLLALIYLVFFQTPNYVFSLSICIFFAIGLYELLRMYKVSWVNILGVIGLYLVLSYCIIYKFEYAVSQVIRGGAVITWCFVVPFVLIAKPKKISPLMICAFGLVIFLLSTYSVVILKDVLGIWQLVSIMAVAWVADTGAYVIGKLFGKHRLAPDISPGKSVEGAIAAMVLVIIYLSILKYFDVAIYLYNYMAVVKFGVVLVIVSIVGDLFESWLKRVAGVKDSGTILPGHGGVFDRVDSLIAVVAIAYAMIRGLM